MPPLPRITSPCSGLTASRNFNSAISFALSIFFARFLTPILIAPLARWPCDNLMIFGDNHALTERLEPVGTEEVEWRNWALRNNFLPGAG